MSETISRKEVLDLLARGKIGIDEAVGLLEQVGKGASEEVGGTDPVYKAELPEDEDEKIASIKVDESSNINAEEDIVSEMKADESQKHQMKTPRWLRVRVDNLETGRNKVAVNIPFGMVKFGLGIAKKFNPDIDGVDLDQISEEMTQAEPGVIVEVEDTESNEHVRIFFE